MNRELLVERLPFARLNGDHLSLWELDSSAPLDWAAANELGRQFADILIGHMREFEAPSLLGHVIAAMGVRPTMTCGVQIGFLHRLAERACA